MEIITFFSLDKGKVNKSGKVRQKNICPILPGKSIDDRGMFCATEIVMMINAKVYIYSFTYFSKQIYRKSVTPKTVCCKWQNRYNEFQSTFVL